MLDWDVVRWRCDGTRGNGLFGLFTYAVAVEDVLVGYGELDSVAGCGGF